MDLEKIENEGKEDFIKGKSLLNCPYDPHSDKREAWMKGFSSEERAQMNPIFKWLTGESFFATVTGWILFILLIGVVYNFWIFIADWLGIPWGLKW